MPKKRELLKTSLRTMLRIAGYTLGPLGAFAGDILGDVIGGTIEFFSPEKILGDNLVSFPGFIIVDASLEDFFEISKRNQGFSRIIQKVLEDAFNQLKQEYPLSKKEEECFQNWIKAIKKGQVLDKDNIKRLMGKDFSANGIDRQGLWNHLEEWLRQSANAQVSDKLLDFLKKSLPEAIRLSLYKEIAKNQEWFNQLVLSFVYQIAQVVESVHKAFQLVEEDLEKIRDQTLKSLQKIETKTEAIDAKGIVQ